MTLIREYNAQEETAPGIVLFGGNPERKNEVVLLIKNNLKTVTAIGNFVASVGVFTN